MQSYRWCSRADVSAHENRGAASCHAPVSYEVVSYGQGFSTKMGPTLSSQARPTQYTASRTNCVTGDQGQLGSAHASAAFAGAAIPNTPNVNADATSTAIFRFMN